MLARTEATELVSAETLSAREALACWETAEALGWVAPLDPELSPLCHRVIGTLVRLSEPKR